MLGASYVASETVLLVNRYSTQGMGGDRLEPNLTMSKAMRIPSYFFLTILLGAANSLLADAVYSVTDLGALGVNETVQGKGINNWGEVVGYEYPSGGPAGLSHAFVYIDGRMTDLGPGSALSINNRGQITGQFTTSTGNYHAFLYSNGQRTDLGAFGGINSIGQAINDVGQVTGAVNPISSGAHAFLYSDGNLSIPGTLTEGRGINDAGEIAGYTSKGPALYSHGQTTDLSIVGGVGFAINNAGQITGYFNPIGGEHAFLYSNGEMADLGTLPGTRYAEGYAINNSGQVVGNSGAHAFLYSNGHMMDLNTLIDPSLGLTLYEATGINDKGQIVTNASSPAGGRAYLLTPVPEPSTWALLGIGSLALFARLRRSSMHCRCFALAAHKWHSKCI